MDFNNFHIWKQERMPTACKQFVISFKNMCMRPDSAACVARLGVFNELYLSHQLHDAAGNILGVHYKGTNIINFIHRTIQQTKKSN